MNIAVIFGGESCEHDISIITGEQLIDNLDEYLYNVYPIYIDKMGKWFTGYEIKDIDNFSVNKFKKIKECAFVPDDQYLYIKKKSGFKKFVKIDMVFVCLHGLRGEDGMVASVLELSKIPYSSSSICSSSVCMDKCIFKSYAKGLGVRVVDGLVIRKKDFYFSDKDCFDWVEELGYPIIIKPSRQGSSIGIEVCESDDDLREKLEKAFKFDEKLLVEKFVDVDKEVNIAIVNNLGENIFSNTEEPIKSDKILSFEMKYKKDLGGFETIKRIVPADISQEQENEIRLMAKTLYESLEMFGVVRFDFLISKDGVVYVNEVNTIPGSMANYLFDKDIMDYKKLIECLIGCSFVRSDQNARIQKVFDSGVLEGGFDGFKK